VVAKEKCARKNVVCKKTFALLALIFLGALPLQAQADDSGLFIQAESFYYARNYPLALESYAAFVARAPFSELVPDAQYHRAVSLFALKRDNEALALFDLILKRHRSTRYLSFISFYQGMIRFRAKDYQAAVADFNTYLEKEGDPALSAQALYYRAVCQTETGAYGEAEATLDRFLKSYPKNDLAGHGFLLLAYARFKRGDADGLIALYRDPRTAALPAALKDKFLLYYADALSNKNRRDEAKAIYENLLAASPDIAAAALAKLFGLAEKAGRVKELEALARRAEESLAADPARLVEFWTNVGIACFTAGQLESAEFYFTRAWNGRDKTAVGEAVPLYLSEVYSRRGNDAKALAVLDEYLAGKDNQAEGVLFRLGSLAASVGDDAKAIAYLAAFLKKYPKALKLAEAQYLLAYACYRSGEIDRGLEVSAAAVARWPDDHKMKSVLVRLRAKLLRKKGDAAGAGELLAGFLAVRPNDAETRRDYVELLFAQKKYAAVNAALKDAGPTAALKKENIVLYLSLKYYEGLAFVAGKEYERALISFAEFSPEYVEKRGVAEIYPSILFYRGWAFYRMGKTAEAAPLFKSFVDRFPKHELFPRALYLAGWCLYTGGNFQEAAGYFRSLSEKAADRETALKGSFFLGKSLLAQGKAVEAAKLFGGIYEQSPSSAFAPDALFEYARLQADQNKANEAAAAWVRLAETYPKHALAEEALWSRAQLFYRMNDPARALDAFAYYRERFPSGGQVDASWYWSGLCAAGRGDKTGALGYWEKLIHGFRDSSFRSEALKKAAEAYRQAGANDKALSAYQELAAAYPKEAKAIGAQDQARELQYLVMGYGNEEARLSARAEKEGGFATHAGRLAMADLAAFYLADREQKKIDAAYAIVLQVAGVKDDREAESRARFLLGEYFNKKKDYARAGNEFLKAALADASNREQAAQSLYQAASMMKLAGDSPSAQELVDRLAKNFPGSRWTAEGKKLMEARP
jgi:TolA-binding protein